MQMTDSDRQFFLRVGHPETDLPQLSRAMRDVRLTISNGSEEKPISASEAIKVLGRETFLSGISRAAFHCSCGRTSSDGQYIAFSLSHWWKL